MSGPLSSHSTRLTCQINKILYRFNSDGGANGRAQACFSGFMMTSKNKFLSFAGACVQSQKLYIVKNGCRSLSLSLSLYPGMAHTLAYAELNY